LGERASRTNALTQDLSGYRVVAFATHGLIPGDVPGLSQPALAMSTRDPSGYLLTSQDILGMKLDADWVILSACNSGAGDGAGSDALTGLGRSFFYAGSKSIYVTQWPVESESAKRLVTKTLTYYQKDSLGRAVSANKSARDLLSTGSMKMAGDDISFAHPAFWAPYIVVGEPGR
jgi:CHAT domain-containing protein